MPTPSVILIGAGSMGGSLLGAWLAAGGVDATASAVVDPNPSDALVRLCEEHGVALNPGEDRGYDVCVLAVKPQMFPAVLPDLSWPGIADMLFVSIAAGTTIQTIGMLLKERAPAARIVRTMPSLPASIRQGVQLLCEAGGLRGGDREVATALMAAAGETYWCEDEDHLDQVMGVTGCSPAYVFLLAEALQSAAEARGVAPDDARRIAEASVTGAAALLAQDGRDAASLRRAVTSPGGTTQAALEGLRSEFGLPSAISQAVTDAYYRAKELAGEEPIADTAESSSDAAVLHVRLNGVLLCRVDTHALAVGSVILNSLNPDRNGPEDRYSISVGGLNRATAIDAHDAHVRWVTQKPLDIGDRVEVELAGSGPSDPPGTRTVQGPAQKERDDRFFGKASKTSD